MNLFSLAAAAALYAQAASPSRPAPVRALKGSPESSTPGAETEPALRLSAEPKAPPAAGERLTAFGVELSATSDGLRVDHVLATSDASTLGLKGGDLLLD
ncbi:MAG: hypothetical protein HY925_04550, partial [Elusimicrobia bacterium]|nr:hypothetical protein [Elusimicrobiota bacterium]